MERDRYMDPAEAVKFGLTARWGDVANLAFELVTLSPGLYGGAEAFREAAAELPKRRSDPLSQRFREHTESKRYAPPAPAPAYVYQEPTPPPPLPAAAPPRRLPADLLPASTRAPVAIAAYQ